MHILQYMLYALNLVWKVFVNFYTKFWIPYTAKYAFHEELKYEELYYLRVITFQIKIKA